MSKSSMNQKTLSKIIEDSAAKTVGMTRPVFRGQANAN